MFRAIYRKFLYGKELMKGGRRGSVMKEGAAGNGTRGGGGHMRGGPVP